jgi:general stress protein YciG
MGGTRIGGIAAAKTNKRIYGNSFYPTIGELGGIKQTAKTKNRGFASNPKLAPEAGRKGGLNSRRKPKVSEPIEVKKQGIFRSFLDGFNRGRRK